MSTFCTPFVHSLYNSCMFPVQFLHNLSYKFCTSLDPNILYEFCTIIVQESYKSGSRTIIVRFHPQDVVACLPDCWLAVSCSLEVALACFSLPTSASLRFSVYSWRVRIRGSPRSLLPLGDSGLRLGRAGGLRADWSDCLAGWAGQWQDASE